MVSNFDLCILMFNSGNNTYYNDTNNTHYNNINNVLFIAGYVDDLSLFRPKGLVIDNLKDLLKSKFKVTDLDDLHWLLGIQIEYREHDILLSQSVYMNTIFKHFGLTDCNPVTYPLDKNKQIDKATTEADNLNKVNINKVNIKLYQQMVGLFMYIVIRTQPNIAFTVTCLSQFLTKPTKKYYSTIKYIF